MNCCITFRGNNYYYSSEDSWVTFKEIREDEFDGTKVDNNGNRRYVRYSDIVISTNNFWRTYTVTKKKKSLDGFIDDTKNKAINRRYCVCDNEFIVTDDFWRTFYFTKYPEDRVYDNSKALKTRITAIDDNKLLVKTDNFYKDTETIFTSTTEDDKERTKEIIEKAKEKKYIFDNLGSNAQKKCLCYKHFNYDVGKVLMMKLDELHFNLYKNKKARDDGYGSEFEVFAMQRIMNLDFVTDNIVEGSYDGKVDAIFKENERKIRCFQIKFITSIKPDDIFTMRDNISMAVDRLHYKELPKECSSLKEFMERNSSFFNKNFSINIVSDPVAHSMKVNDSFYSVSNGKEVIKYNYYNSSEIVYKYVSDYLLGQLGKRQLSIKKRGKNFVKADNCDNYFMFVNAKELCEEISSSFSTKEEVDELFINNVRGYLGINKKMIDTIKNCSSKFSLYNNGVSICCKKIDDEEDDQFFILDNPFIVNGQQTILTLFHAFKNNLDLSKVEVPIFIKPYNDDENQMLEVAECNNTQNPVKDIDLLCSNLNVRNISKKIYEIDLKKHKTDFNKWLSLKMFSTGSNSNMEISTAIIDSKNILAVNDYFKVLLPILFHYINRNQVNKIDMHLKNFNKSTAKYLELYKDLDKEIKELLNIDSDFFYDIADSVKHAKMFVNANEKFLPAENLFGIANYYGISDDEFKDELIRIGFDVNDEIKKRISFVSKKEKCKELQEFFVAKKTWNDII